MDNENSDVPGVRLDPKNVLHREKGDKYNFKKLDDIIRSLSQNR